MQAQLKRIAEQSGVPLEVTRRMPRLPAATPREVTVSDAEFEAVLRHAPPYLELLLLLAKEAGLRAKTATRLTRGQCDFDGRRITGTTKGGSKFDIPMTDRLHSRLLWYCAAAPDSVTPLSAIFRANRQPPNLACVRSAICAARFAAGVSKTWGLHDLRRTAARALYQRTRDIRKVQAFLGHKMLWTTCWYLGNAQIGLNAEDMNPPIPTEKERVA